MGAALYFIEDVPVVSDATIADAGLAYALAPGCAHRLASQGPGGAGGAICSLVADGLGFFPDRQAWHDLGLRGGKKIWFGYATDAPPGPADLAAPKQLAGQGVMLFDDNSWLIPRAIAFQDGAPRLAAPASIKWTGDKWIKGGVKKCYQRLDAIGQEFWDRFMLPIDDPAKELKAVECDDWAAELLAINYRVTRFEVGALSLLSWGGAEVAVEILKASIDFDGYLNHLAFLGAQTQKKSD